MSPTQAERKTAAVTGASDGIGRQTVIELVKKHGFRVLVHGRTQAKAEATCRALGVDHVVPVWGDFTSLGEVKALGRQIAEATPALDVLVNNAGVFMKERQTTSDGFEVTFQVNHLAPLALTHAVLPSLKAARAARVVNVSSMAHQRGHVDVKDLNFEQRFDGYSAYSATKLMNVYFTHELARRLTAAHSPVTTCALHPGIITTKLLRAGFGATGASLESGARTSVYCATSGALDGVTGRYYSDGREVPCAPHANDSKLEKMLYVECCRLAGVAPL